MMTTSLNGQLPDLMRMLEVNLRSGYSVKQAFEIIAKDAEPPLSQEAQWVLDELAGGQSIISVLDSWLDRTPSADLDLVVAAMKVQFEVGGNLADKLKFLGQVMEKRRGI